MKRRAIGWWAWRALILLLLTVLASALWTAYQIVYSATMPTTKVSADVAVVLGAAVWRDQPSPVFAARIDYALELLDAGQVAYLIFTGGLGTGDDTAESSAAARYAIERGAPADRLLCETTSRTTWGNLHAAAAIMQEHGWQRAAIVSDPLHIYRAMMMANNLGMAPQAAPTPYTRYRTWNSRLPFLLREFYFVYHYRLQRLFPWQSTTAMDEISGHCAVHSS